MRLLNAKGDRVPFSLWHFLLGIWRRMDACNITGLAAQVSYYFALALFPFLILVGAIVGTLPFTHAWQPVLNWITSSLPDETRDVVFQTVANLTQGRTGFFSFGVLGTLWAASSGFMNLASALNTVYHVPETRSYWHRLGLCILMLFGLALAMLASFGLLSAGDRFDRWLVSSGAPSGFLHPVFVVLRWLVSVFLIVIFISLMDFLLPNLKRRWRWIRPGMGLMVSGWILASLGFNFYLKHFASYNQTYGVLGVFVILMVWMYIAALIALSGNLIDAEWQKLRNAVPHTVPSIPDVVSSDVSGSAIRAS